MLKNLVGRQLKLSNPTEGTFQYQGHIDQDLEEWLSPRGSKPNRSFLYEEDKQDYTQIEGSDPDGATITNQYPEG